jgi:transposase-like protein
MPLTEDEKAKLRELREEGRNTHPTWKLSAAEKEQLVHCYLKGETVKELAGRFGIARAAVYYHVDKASGDR